MEKNLENDMESGITYFLQGRYWGNWIMTWKVGLSTSREDTEILHDLHIL